MKMSGAAQTPAPTEGGCRETVHREYYYSGMHSSSGALSSLSVLRAAAEETTTI